MLLRISRTLVAACLALLAGPTLLLAQGILIDVRPPDHWRLPRPIIRPAPQPVESSYKIKELGVNVNLADQVAKVQVSQTFVNTGSRQMEVSFVFPLPYEGAVDRLTFMVDGKEYEARLLKATEAREIYEGYVRRFQDPALMEWIGTGMFKTSVFPVPPGGERTVTLRYSQVCRKMDGLTDLMFPLSTAKFTSKPVEKVSINVAVQSSAKILNVYSPSHSVEIERPGNLQAIVKYTATNEVPTSDFRLFYDIGDQNVGASVLSYRPETGEDGYFLMMVSPDIDKSTQQVARKTVVFVVDRSGSMSGKKMDQAKDALKFVLNNLREGDLFNVIAYDSTVESFRPELQRFSDETREQALGFVSGIFAGGSTNIDGALKATLGQLKDDKQPTYVIFLTDGLPTAGETGQAKIAANARERNEVHARIFAYGVGYDVNSRLLDKLAREGNGLSGFVRPNEDIEQSVSALYSRIGSPVMTNVEIAWDAEDLKAADGTLTNRVYPKEVFDLFAGDQLVVVGRYRKAGAAKVTITGKVGDAQKKLDFPAQLVSESNDESYAFVEKLWAMRRVGEIIDEIDLSGKNEELVNELVSLSTRHGIITPYTSFLAEDDVALASRQRGNRALNRDGFAAPAADREQASIRLDELKNESGAGGVAQRDLKGQFQAAARAPSAAKQTFRNAKDDSVVQVNNVQQVGRKAFFLRDNVWIDSSITPEDEKKAVQIERYSKEYFDLATKHGKDAAKYLAIEGKVLVKLDDQTYEF